jgi:hypothetical protein
MKIRIEEEKNVWYVAFKRYFFSNWKRESNVYGEAMFGNTIDLKYKTKESAVERVKTILQQNHIEK